MTYKEAKELYDRAKDETALNALIEFFEYHNNNKNILFYIANCYNELQRFSDGLNYILSKVDNDTFPYERYSTIILKLFKGLLMTMIDKESNKPINKEEYEQEVNKIKQLWLDFKDVRFLSMYGFECRKIDCQKDYLLLLKSVEDENVLSDSYVKNAQLWCHYDVYIKKFVINQEITKEEVCEFIKNAEFITTNCCQEELDKYYSNPFGLTVVKVIKVLNQTMSCKYKEIIKWISLLDVDKLPLDDESQYTTSFWRECESASTREFYYYQIARAYEKTEEYEKCIEICNKALSEDIKFHYRNNLWIKARKLYCECQIAEDKEKAILNYKKVIDKNIYKIRRECIKEGPAGERLWERFEVSNEIANQNPKQYPRVMEVYIFKNDWESVEKECKSVPEMQAMCKQIGDGMCDEIICDLELQMRICNGESVYDLVEKPDKLPYARLIMLRNGWDAFFGGDYVTNRVLMIPPANLDIRRFYPNVKLRFSVPYAFRRKRNESSHRLIKSECMDNDKPIVSKPKKNNPNPTKRKRRKRSRRRRRRRITGVGDKADCIRTKVPLLCALCVLSSAFVAMNTVLCYLNRNRTKLRGSNFPL